jgi:hypothetical protein
LKSSLIDLSSAFADAGIAELLDAQRRIRPTCGRRRGQERVDLVDLLVLSVTGRALDLEGHERRAPVVGELTGVARCQRRADVRRVARRPDAPDDVANATADVACGSS